MLNDVVSVCMTIYEDDGVNIIKHELTIEKQEPNHPLVYYNPSELPCSRVLPVYLPPVSIRKNTFT